MPAGFKRLARCLSSVWLLTWSLSQVHANETQPAFFVELVDHRGIPLSVQRFLGKPSIVHFGFTHCPVVCPTTLAEVTRVMRALGAQADAVNFIFVTVDPERDSPSVLRDYLSVFDERIVGVTGPAAAIERFAAHFKAGFAKRPALGGGDYDMDHAVFGYLKDGQWASVGTVYMGSGADESFVSQQLQRLIAPAEAAGRG